MAVAGQHPCREGCLSKAMVAVVPIGGELPTWAFDVTVNLTMVPHFL